MSTTNIIDQVKGSKNVVYSQEKDGYGTIVFQEGDHYFGITYADSIDGSTAYEFHKKLTQRGTWTYQPMQFSKKGNSLQDLNNFIVSKGVVPQQETQAIPVEESVDQRDKSSQPRQPGRGLTIDAIHNFLDTYHGAVEVGLSYGMETARDVAIALGQKRNYCIFNGNTCYLTDDFLMYQEDLIGTNALNDDNPAIRDWAESRCE